MLTSYKQTAIWDQGLCELMRLRNCNDCQALQPLSEDSQAGLQPSPATLALSALRTFRPRTAYAHRDKFSCQLKRSLHAREITVWAYSATRCTRCTEQLPTCDNGLAAARYIFAWWPNIPSSVLAYNVAEHQVDIVIHTIMFLDSSKSPGRSVQG